MAAVHRQPPPLIPDQSPKLHGSVDEAGDIKRTASTEWGSPSRRKNGRMKLNRRNRGGTVEWYLATPQVAEQDELSLEEESQKKRDVDELKKRAAIARFRTRVGDIGVGLKSHRKWKRLLKLKVQKELYIPPSISVANFANLMKIPLGIDVGLGSD